MKAQAGGCVGAPGIRLLPAVVLAGIALVLVACHRDAIPETGASAPPAEPTPEARHDPAPPSDASDAPGEEENALPAAARSFVLASGQSAELVTGTRLHFERVVDDSRCPAGAQCIWAGEVRIALSLHREGESQAFELATASRPHSTQGGHRIGFLSYGACPKTQDAPEGSECATLEVQPASGETTDPDESAAAPTQP